MTLLVGRGSAYDLYLTGALKHASLIRAATPGVSMQRYRDGEADMVAGVRQSLEREFGNDAAYRVLPGRIATIDQAMVLPAAMAASLPALDGFVAAALADGFVRRALDASGQAHLQTGQAGPQAPAARP
jgi:polar amino acid transport system substrate-binding protein